MQEAQALLEVFNNDQYKKLFEKTMEEVPHIEYDEMLDGIIIDLEQIKDEGETENYGFLLEVDKDIFKYDACLLEMI